MSLEVLTSLIVSFCANYAAGNMDKALECSDYVVNCAVKEDTNKERTEKCFINFKKGERYEEKNNNR
jgi:hypothetical protein